MSRDSPTKEKRQYEGFFKRPLPREWIVQKFERPCAKSTIPPKPVVDAVMNLETIAARELTAALRVSR